MKFRLTLIFGFVLTALIPIAGRASMADKLSASLRALDRQSAHADSLVEIVVFLEDRTAQENLTYSLSGPKMKRADRIKTVLNRLSTARATGAAQIENYLSRHATGETRRFWIVPAYSAIVPVSKLDELAAMESVRMIVENVALSFEEPVDVLAAGELATSASSQLNLINVPWLWQRGLKGNGRLVCSFDTGVESTHPALSAKWRGNFAPRSEAWYSPVNPNTNPYDVAGHGTHTMGIMVGSTATDTFGVAPAAQWMTAGVVDQGRNFSTTLADIIAAFQWALNPDGNPNTTDDVPDVILNSWGVPAGLFPPCDPTFWGVIDAVEAAGIVTIFAAGNEGPNPQTLRDPADRATTPLNSFSVGAVDNNRVIAGFSSRGPSRCNTTEIKPEVVAPGVTILSSTKGGGYAYMSGTSMAAPYIAGLVALCRQYNPDATVEQIKTALIQSAMDLGPVGEDNAYGHGLVDASRLLEFLPVPGGFSFELVGDPYIVSGVALPGTDVSLQVMLNNPSGNVSQVTGRLYSNDPASAVVIDGVKNFLFGSGGTTSLNQAPFTINLDPTLFHGTRLSFSLHIELENGSVVDTVSFAMTVGYPSPGAVLEHAGGALNWTVSDFGQYGLAPGSIYNLGGAGLTAFDSENLLYEAGIIVGRNTLQLSSSVRGADGAFRPSDFSPILPISSARESSDGAVLYRARMVDTYSDISIPITINQQTTGFTTEESMGVTLVRYQLVNTSLERLTHLAFGFLADFDLSANNDRLQLDEIGGLLWQTNDDGLFVGLLALHGIEAFQGLVNTSTKSGFTPAQQFDLITGAVTKLDDSTTGDLMMMVVSGAKTIEVGDSVEIAFAIVAGRTINELYASVESARRAYDISTPVTEDRRDLLPQAFTLEQNYPNPFNPTTTIAFSLPTTTDVKLEIFNSLGQQVRVLHHGDLPAGTHHVEWDAADRNGNKVASGVYFYRLSTDLQTDSRKMILLK